MQNSQELTEESNRQKFPKRNFFCYRWRVLDTFSKSIDRHMFQLQAQGTGNPATLLSERILQLYKGRLSGSSDKNGLIGDLAHEALKFLDRQTDEQRMIEKAEVLLSKAMISLIDRTFHVLLALSTELNTLLGMSELFITSSEPLVTRRVTNSETSRPTCIQAHIATSHFRLLIEGTSDNISFYLIPAEYILAIDEFTSQYEPISVWKANFAPQDQVYWTSTHEVLREELLDRSCADLLRRLVETSQQAIAPSYAAQKAKVVVKTSLEFQKSDRWHKEIEPDNISADRTCTDSVSSLASLHQEYGTFDNVNNDYPTPSVENVFVHPADQKQPELVLLTGEDKEKPKPLSINHSHDAVPDAEFPKSKFPKPEFPKSEFSKPEFPKSEFSKPEFPKSEFSKPEFPKSELPKFSEPHKFERLPKFADANKPPWAGVQHEMIPPPIVALEAPIEKPSFDLKADHCADTSKAATKSATKKRSRRKSNTRKNRKEKKRK